MSCLGEQNCPGLLVETSGEMVVVGIGVNLLIKPQILNVNDSLQI